MDWIGVGLGWVGMGCVRWFVGGGEKGWLEWVGGFWRLIGWVRLIGGVGGVSWWFVGWVVKLVGWLRGVGWGGVS